MQGRQCLGFEVVGAADSGPADPVVVRVKLGRGAERVVSPACSPEPAVRVTTQRALHKPRSLTAGSNDESASQYP